MEIFNQVTGLLQIRFSAFAQLTLPPLRGKLDGGFSEGKAVYFGVVTPLLTSPQGGEEQICKTSVKCVCFPLLVPDSYPPR